MNFKKWVVISLVTLGLAPAVMASKPDPLQEVDEIVRSAITNWKGECLIPVDTQKPGDKQPSILDLTAPLMEGAITAAYPLYEDLFVTAHTKGFGNCVAAFAGTLDKLTPEDLDAIKQSMDTLIDPSDKLAMIKGLTQIKYTWEATKRANPNTKLVVQDALELAKYKGLQFFQSGIPDDDNFMLIEDICKYLDRIAAIRLAKGHTNSNPINFADKTKKQLREEVSNLLDQARPNMPAADKTRVLDYYVPSYYYIFGIIPKEQVVLLTLGSAWDEAMPKPQRNWEKEHSESLMHDFLDMAETNGWEDAIIGFAQKTLQISADEATFLGKKLEDVRLQDPDPDKTLKERQGYMENMFMAARVTQYMRKLGVYCSYLFTYLLFLDGDSLWTMEQATGPMCNLQTLRETLSLWSSLTTAPTPLTKKAKKEASTPAPVVEKKVTPAPAPSGGWFGGFGFM